MQKLYLCFVFAFLACSKTIDFEIPLQQYLVVNCILENNQFAKVNLFSSSPSIENIEVLQLCDASISMEDKSNMSYKFLLEEEKDECFYVTVDKIILGGEYSIKVIANEIIVSASTNLPETLVAETKLVFVTKTKEVKDPNGIVNERTFFRINLETERDKNDPEYSVGINVNSPSISKSSYNLNLEGIEYYAANIIDGLSVVSKDKINESLIKYSVEYFLEDFKAMDTIFVKFSLVNDDLVNYLKNYGMLIESTNDPFAIPINPYSNIEGGLGIFGGMTSIIDTIIFKVPW